MKHKIVTLLLLISLPFLILYAWLMAQIKFCLIYFKLQRALKTQTYKIMINDDESKFVITDKNYYVIKRTKNSEINLIFPGILTISSRGSYNNMAGFMKFPFVMLFFKLIKSKTLPILKQHEDFHFL